MSIIIFEKAAQFHEKHYCKGLMKISRMVCELEPFKDFILTSEVKAHYLKKSFLSICAKLPYELVRRYCNQFLNYFFISSHFTLSSIRSHGKGES